MARQAGGLIGLAVAAGLAAAAAAQPAPPGSVGVWRLALDGSNRSCPVTLSADPGAIGRLVRFPAGCRRALPILNGVGAWLSGEGGSMRLVGTDGQAVLDFRDRGPDATFLARTATGDLYRIARADDEAALRRARPTPIAIGVPQVTPVDPAKAPAAATLPGTYVVDRYTEKEVCRLDLGRAMLSSEGRFEARLLEGCRDPGLGTFDPVAWRYAAGRLTLIARRGHEVTLISEREGHWRRDPEVGATLILRRAP